MQTLRSRRCSTAIIGLSSQGQAQPARYASMERPRLYSLSLSGRCAVLLPEGVGERVKKYSDWLTAEKKRQQARRKKAEKAYRQTNRLRYRREIGNAEFMEDALEAAERELKGVDTAKETFRRQLLGIYNWASGLVESAPPEDAVQRILEEIHIAQLQL